MCPMSINLSKFAYPEIKQAKLVGNFHKYTFNNGMFANVNRGLRTENINSCTAGVLNAGKTNFMFHAAPEMQPLAGIKKEIQSKVEALRETCDEVKAFICGGLELNQKDSESVRSFDLYNTIADTLDELGVKFTMMCGKQKGASMDNIYAINENVNVWSDAFKNLFTPEFKNLSKDEILGLLEKEYQFVESNAEHNINIFDKYVQKNQYALG